MTHIAFQEHLDGRAVDWLEKVTDGSTGLRSERKQLAHRNEESESVSVGFEEVESQEWAEKVYRPDIKAKWDQLYKKPGYNPLEK